VGRWGQSGSGLCIGFYSEGKDTGGDLWTTPIRIKQIRFFYYYYFSNPWLSLTSTDTVYKMRIVVD
jgi:hypothetical protein